VAGGGKWSPFHKKLQRDRFKKYRRVSFKTPEEMSNRERSLWKVFLSRMGQFREEVWNASLKRGREGNKEFWVKKGKKKRRWEYESRKLKEEIDEAAGDWR